MENKFRIYGSRTTGQFVSVACVSTVHSASDHLLAGDLLHDRLAGYGAAYIKQMYSEYERLRPIGSELQGL